MSKCKCDRNVRIRNNPDGTVTRQGTPCQWCLERALADEKKAFEEKIKVCKTSQDVADMSEELVTHIDKIEEIKVHLTGNLDVDSKLDLTKVPVEELKNVSTPLEDVIKGAKKPDHKEYRDKVNKYVNTPSVKSECPIKPTDKNIMDENQKKLVERVTKKNK